MLDSNLKSQLKSYLERVTLPFEIVASVDATEASQEMLGLLNDIVELCDKITLKTDGNDARRPRARSTGKFQHAILGKGGGQPLKARPIAIVGVAGEKVADRLAISRKIMH